VAVPFRSSLPYPFSILFRIGYRPEGEVVVGKRITVVVVEDSNVTRKLVAAHLAQDERFHIEQAGTGAEGLQKAASPECAVVVLDMTLPDMNGRQFIEFLCHARPDPPSVIAITAASESSLPDSIIEGPCAGLVSAVFRKPFDHARLREAVAMCARR
jgi:DNA-binding response OmpR family regulator